MEKKTIKERWKAICEEYLEAFCKKHDYDLNECYWPGDDVGTLVLLDDMCTSANMEEIRYDLDNDIPVGQFEEWWAYEYDIHDVESETGMHLRHINFQSWCKGAPRPYTQQELAQLLAVKEIKFKENYKNL